MVVEDDVTLVPTEETDRCIIIIPRSEGDSESMWERFYSVNRGHVIQTQQIGRET